MRINNVSSETSLQGIIWVSVITILVTAGFITFYVFTSVDKLSFLGFFEWYFMILRGILDSSDSDKWGAAAIYVLLPSGLYIGLAVMLFLRKVALLRQDTRPTIRYVDFLSDRINFRYNRPQYDFVCGYGDVKGLKMNLISELVHSKYGSYPALKEVELNFHLSDDKVVSVKNTPINKMNFIYKVIDCSRRINNFSYKFSGTGAPSGIKEKIEDYKTKGLKQILSKPQENACKGTSMLLFVIGCYLIFGFKDEIPNLIGDSIIWIILTPALILMALSFICDAFLIADKMRERKFK